MTDKERREEINQLHNEILERSEKLKHHYQQLNDVLPFSKNVLLVASRTKVDEMQHFIIANRSVSLEVLSQLCVELNFKPLDLIMSMGAYEMAKYQGKVEMLSKNRKRVFNPKNRN